MVAVWTLAFAQLRKKKVHNGLIALLILLSALLLTTAITVIRNTENLFEERHLETSGAHQILQLDKGGLDPQEVRQWWAGQEGVAVSAVMPYKSLSRATYKGKELQNLTSYMMDTPERPFGVDELMLAQGDDNNSQPKPGTIWIPTSMAYTNDISIGDTLGFTADARLFELKVSAIVIDLPLGGPFSTSSRIWMNPADYQLHMNSVQGADMYMLGLRYDDYSKQPQYWERFEQFLGTPYLESIINFESITSFYFIINTIIGFVMIFLGVVMMLVALYTIGFTISDAILSNYRTIGILKASGLSSPRIMAAYLLQYAFLSVIAIIPGLLTAKVLSGIIIEQSLSFLRAEHSSMNVQETGMSLLVGLTLFLLILLCVWIYANKARSIQPMQAIRFGMSETAHSRITGRWSAAGHRSSGLERWPVSWVIGSRNIIKNVKGSILMLLLAAITSAVLVFGLVLLNSVYNIQETSPDWGYDSSDISVLVVNPAAFETELFTQEIAADPRMKNIGWLQYATGVVAADQTADRASVNFQLSAADGSFDDMGYTNLKGRNPRNRNEISIGVQISRQLHKEIGDVLEIFIEGDKHTLTVTGIYQAIANMSNSGRMTIDVLKDRNPDFALLNLKDSTAAGSVAEELNAKYGGTITAAAQQTLLDSVFKEATAVLIIPMSILGLLFIAVSYIIIYSTCRINIRKETKTYGIYKSIGLTSARIRGAITWGIVGLSVLGTLLGVISGIYVLPLLLRNILSTYGIVKLPLILNSRGILAAAALSIAAGGLGCWLASRVIHKTSPRLLVTE